MSRGSGVSSGRGLCETTARVYSRTVVFHLSQSHILNRINVGCVVGGERGAGHAVAHRMGHAYSPGCKRSGARAGAQGHTARRSAAGR